VGFIVFIFVLKKITWVVSWVGFNYINPGLLS